MSDKLTMVVDLKAQIGQFNATMDQAKKKVIDSFSGKGIKNYSDELNKISRIFDKLALTTSNPIDSKATFGQMQKELTQADQRVKRLQESLDNLKRMSFNERISFLPDNFSLNLDKAKTALHGFYQEMGNIKNAKLGDEYKKNADAIEEYNSKLEKLNEYQKELNNAQINKKQAEEKLKEIQTQLDLNKTYREQLDSFRERNKLEAEYKKLVADNTFSEEEIKNAASSKTSFSEIIKRFDPKVQKALEEEQKKRENSPFNQLKGQKASEKAQVKNNNPSITDKEAKEKLEEIVRLYKDLEVAQERFRDSGGIESNLKNDTTALSELNEKIQTDSDEIEKLNTIIKDSNDAIKSRTSKIQEANTAIAADTEEVEELTKKQTELEEAFASTQNKKMEDAYKKLGEALAQCGLSLDQFGNIEERVEKDAKGLLQSLYDENVVAPELESAIQGVAGSFDVMGEAVNTTTVALDKNAESFDKLKDREQNIDQLANRAKYFVGFAGIINIARKSLRDAIKTVGELDKAMTQMAVVTKSTVSDYWDQLPKYTERANKLGATIRDMYEADTLYYQQGLKTNQVMQVANETMKMARIAGLGAAEATDRMTNALRGFNMEINEASAERINDVYSKLAAITASNVDEISTAMTKTASIAHSAGMEFETTAAFLSQIIETTRESAETAGTALKTVIARFQELKKAPSEIGEVDGEVVNANKIEGALRTVGVALRDSEGQFRKLDDVFMELAGKWGSLDKNTQRYLATIAAGSRQQSRFIALMQDYSHTVELVDAAYNSAGTSQKQYEKTLDSLQTKINALNNAWDTFTMSLFDSNLIKGAVDFGTGIMNMLNKFLDFFDVLDLGIPKILLVVAGIDKLGIAVRVFTNELKKSGSVLKSFGAVGTSFVQHFKDTYGGVKVATEALENFNKAEKVAAEAQQATITATEEEIAAAQEAAIAYEKQAAAILKRDEAIKAGASNRVIGGHNSQVTVTSKAFLAANAKVPDLAAKEANRQAKIVQSEKELVKARMALVSSTNLDSDSQERLNILLEAQNNLEMDSERFTYLCAAATDEKTTASLKNAMANKEEISTEEIKQVVEENGRKIKYKYVQANILQTASESKLLAVLTLGTSKTILDTFAKKANAAAAISAAKANLLLAAGISAVALAAAAVVGTLFLIYKAIQGILKARLSERLKDAQEHLENTTEAIKECKDALADLEEQQDKYKSLHEELNKNVQGTEEWKKKLVECNEQVYELLQKYPTLANYIQRVSSGELIISEEGWNTIAAQAQDKLRNAQIANYAAQKEAFDLTQKNGFDQVYEKLAKDLSSSGQFKKRAELGGELFVEDIRKAIQTSSSIEEGLDKVNIKEVDLSTDTLKSLKDWKNSVVENTKALDILGGALVGDDFENAMEQAGASFLENAYMKNQKETEQMIGNDWFHTGAFSDKNRAANIMASGDLGKDFRDNKYFKEIAKYYGLKDSDFTGNDTRDLAKWYAATQGIEVTDDILEKAKFGSDRMSLINKALKSYDTKRQTEIAEKAIKDNQNLDLLGRFSQVSSLYSSDIAKLEALYKDKNTSEEVKTAIEEKLEEAGVSTFTNLYWNEFQKVLDNNTVDVNDLYKMGEKLSLDLVDDYARLRSRENALGIGNTDFSQILSKQGGEEILTKLFSFDTSSLEDLELARKTLTDKWPTLTNEINILIDQIKDFGGAISKLDIQTLIDRTKGLSAELAKLSGYQASDIFSEETKKLFVDTGVATEEDFLQTVSGEYIYQGSLEDLTKAIVENTDALKNQADKLDEQLVLAEDFRTFSEGKGENISDYDINNFLRAHQDSLGSLGVPGIENGAEYDNLAPELKTKAREKITELGSLITETTVEEMKKKIAEALAQSISSTNTSAINLAELLQENGGLDAQALERASVLELHEGEEGYNALIQQLNKLKKQYGETSKEYKDFLKTLTNKNNTAAAEKEMKNLISTSQSFMENYEKAGNNAELKMAEVLEQARKFSLDGTKITADNYELYAELFMRFSEGNYEAYQAIANLLLDQQGLTQTQIKQFWAGNLEITTDGLKQIATLAQSFGLGFTQVVGNKSYLKGWNDIGGFVKSSGGGGADAWEDPYNWLWNINKRINKEIFERERLERRYEKAVEDTIKTEQDLYDISKKELQNLERQARLERDKGTKAMQEAQMMMQQRPDFANYVSWDTTNGQIQVDYNSIDKLGWGSARGSAFEDFVGRLEELIEEVQDSQTTLEEIEDLAEDIKNRGREQYLELQDRIKNALVEVNRREIDTREKINESIKTAQDELLNKIQEEISETRQIRSNQEKEQELEDKRQRLSYLRRDTTGANAVQIKKLEEELNKGEQSYTDSLTDQTLQNIQKANQKAEEQRAEEIEIMNNQLTRWQETGAIWETVNTSIQEGFDNPDNFLNSQVGALLATAENKRALSELQQADWEKELENQAKLAELFNNGQLYQQGEETLNEVRTCAEDLNREQINIGRIGNLDQNMAELLKVYPKDYSDKVTSGVGGIGRIDKSTDSIFKLLCGKDGESIISKTLNGISSAIEQIRFNIASKLLPKLGIGTPIQIGVDRVVGAIGGITGPQAEGGLNTKTGLAWLDGTMSKPEYVLSADQTKAFFNLVDTLTSNEGKGGGISGDNYFDIDINVDELANDYDVENVAEKIKQMIWEDSQYRNVNLVNLLR